MITIHWSILLLIATVSSFMGFMLCAILTMAKISDKAIEEMHQERRINDG